MAVAVVDGLAGGPPSPVAPVPRSPAPVSSGSGVSVGVGVGLTSAVGVSVEVVGVRNVVLTPPLRLPVPRLGVFVGLRAIWVPLMVPRPAGVTVAVGTRLLKVGDIRVAGDVTVAVAVGSGSVSGLAKTVAVACTAIDSETLDGCGLKPRWAARTRPPSANMEKGLGILEHATRERPSTKTRSIIAGPRPSDARPDVSTFELLLALANSNLISPRARARMWVMG
ncbi:MAG: hypothetical protein J4N30_06985 [Chloroflexi bacterium]|nr:hypothetical protein [Chloroflexota bacterium]